MYALESKKNKNRKRSSEGGMRISINNPESRAYFQNKDFRSPHKLLNVFITSVSDVMEGRFKESPRYRAI